MPELKTNIDAAQMNGSTLGEAVAAPELVEIDTEPEEEGAQLPEPSVAAVEEAKEPATPAPAESAAKQTTAKGTKASAETRASKAKSHRSSTRHEQDEVIISTDDELSDGEIKMVRKGGLPLNTILLVT